MSSKPRDNAKLIINHSEHHKSQNERGIGLGSASDVGPIGSSNPMTLSHQSTTQGLGPDNTEKHHYGRDAAIGAGGVGAAGLVGRLDCLSHVGT